MKMIFMLASLLLSTNYALASDGSSGCGPGWYVSTKNTILSSAIRATTNAILFPSVTIGMTFGTSNCSEHSLVKNEIEDLKFATENYFEIANDSSKGNGQFLAAFGELMGCGQESLDLFKSGMKNNFPKMFNKKSIDPENLVKETYIMILKDQKLAQACFAV